MRKHNLAKQLAKQLEAKNELRGFCRIGEEGFGLHQLHNGQDIVVIAEVEFKRSRLKRIGFGTSG